MSEWRSGKMPKEPNDKEVAEILDYAALKSRAEKAEAEVEANRYKGAVQESDKYKLKQAITIEKLSVEADSLHKRVLAEIEHTKLAEAVVTKQAQMLCDLRLLARDVISHQPDCSTNKHGGCADWCPITKLSQWDWFVDNYDPITDDDFGPITDEDLDSAKVELQQKDFKCDSYSKILPPLAVTDGFDLLNTKRNKLNQAAKDPLKLKKLRKKLSKILKMIDKINNEQS